MKPPERLRPPQRWHTIVFNGLFALALTVVVTLIAWNVAPDRKSIHLAVLYGSAISSIVGVIFSVIAAWRSSNADKQAAFLLQELENTQRLVRQASSHYPDVFVRHVLEPMKKGATPPDSSWKLHRMDLVLSTPAYGYHVLGIERHTEFRHLLAELQCDKQIIIFSPDSHYFHVANTLLWHLDPATKTEEGPIVNSTELRECLDATMHVLRGQVFETEENKKYHRNGLPRIAVWTGNTTEFRLSAFRYAAETLTFLVLTDHVSLTSDLRKFSGRALALPSAMHEQIVGDAGNPRAFFEQLKVCPYSLEQGDDAKLTSNELETLKFDYLFLRTAQVLFDLHSFKMHCQHVIYEITRQKTDITDAQRLATARNILKNVAAYFSSLKKLPIAVEYLPTGTLQSKRLAVADKLLKLTEDSNTSASDIFKEIMANASREQDDFTRQVDIDKVHNGYSDLDMITAAIYYFLSSGFQESIYAQQRRARARSVRQPLVQPQPYAPVPN